VGNHELEEGGPDMVWLRNFYYDHLEGTVNPGPANGEETTYSWDYQNAHFVQLNQYYDGATDDADIDAYTDALYNWLVEDLDRNTKPVVFVIYHKPAYPNGRGGKDSPQGWERLLKLLNDRKVIAGICADTHTYARYQVDGDWDTFTWEVDVGNAGRLSHGDPHQTFVDITVRDNGEVQFVTWQGMEGVEFTVADVWTAAALTTTLAGPEDGATVDANGAVLSCEPISGAERYQLLFGADRDHMFCLASETPNPPADTICRFPFAQTWWTVRVCMPSGHKVYGLPRRIFAENLTPMRIENLTKGQTYSFIQAAIDDASNGDEIVVGASVWQHLENIDLKGRNIALRSSDPNDPAMVATAVIRGDRPWRPVANFSSGEGIGCVLSGLTITDGNEGIYCNGGCPTITNCNIVANRGPGVEWWTSLMCRYPVIANCTVAGNQGTGMLFPLRGNPSIVNCLITGNRENGIDARSPSMTNCTVAGNGLWGLTGLGGRIANCIIRDNAAGQIQGAPIVTCSDIQGGAPGEGNIDADPCFVEAGHWDSNGLWIAGDYHLAPGSLCVDAGDNASVPSDAADLDGDGNTTEPVPFDLDGNQRMVDADNDGSCVVDMGAYEYFVPPIEVPMKFTPQALNPASAGNWMKVHFVLPEGFAIEDVDTNTPAVIQPGAIESEYVNVFINDDGLVEIEAAFDRGRFCSIVAPDEGMEVMVLGSLTDGRQFYGIDRIKIVTNSLKYLAALATQWLNCWCGNPDWCAGLDLDQDSAVDFTDFALFDGCCIEVIKE
jgi:hypothetical protein